MSAATCNGSARRRSTGWLDSESVMTPSHLHRWWHVAQYAPCVPSVTFVAGDPTDRTGHAGSRLAGATSGSTIGTAGKSCPEAVRLTETSGRREPEHTVRRELEQRRGGLAVPRLGHGLDRAEVADTRTAVDLAVGV